LEKSLGLSVFVSTKVYLEKEKRKRRLKGRAVEGCYIDFPGRGLGEWDVKAYTKLR
jgi:hypothetical protein